MLLVGNLMELPQDRQFCLSWCIVAQAEGVTTELQILNSVNFGDATTTNAFPVHYRTDRTRRNMFHWKN